MLMKEDHKEFVALLRCALLLLGVILTGTLGFDLIETEWDLWTCLYFTVLTITTVGYGDYGVSREGQAFAMVLMISGFGVFTYSLTTMVRIAADTTAARRRKMQREISKCNDHIIICGYGRVGRTICREVMRGGLECLVIENDEESFNRAVEDGLLAMHEQASEDEVLLRAGIRRARGVVCAVDSDAENMFIAVTVRELNPACQIISRAESESAGMKLRHAGAALVVSPHQMAGEKVANALLHPRLTHFMAGAGEDHHRFRLGETIVQPGSVLSGQTIQQFGAEAETLVFVAIEREDGEMVIRPRGGDSFCGGDVVIFAGADTDADLIRSAASSCAVGV